MANLSTDPRWRPGHDLLIDFREANTEALGSDDIRRLAQLIVSTQAEHRGSRLVLVLDGDLAFGLARMWQGNIGDAALLQNTHVTQSMSEAHDWLNAESRGRLEADHGTL